MSPSRPAPAADYEPCMAEAIELALRGRGEVEPNPRVGAVALRGETVVGRGWHRVWGGPHAEVEALREAATAGGCDTLVVTLEPCSSARGQAGKKTPPCVPAILDAGVRRVVIGSPDADPRHRGAGIVQLRAAGVEVIEGVHGARCAAINRPFARWLGLDRPWTIAKWAMTLDGKIATADGESRWITAAPARIRAHALRASVDAVVVGMGTVLADDPALTVRHVAGASPLRVVIDPDGALPLTSQLAITARATRVLAIVAEHAAAAPAAASRLAALEAAGVEVLAVPGGPGRRVDLAVAWRALRARGLRRVMVEGGGKLLGSLFDADCIDQVVAFMAGKVFGGASAPSPVGGVGVTELAAAWTFVETDVRPCGDDFVVTAVRG